ncbi:hypothetical protein DK419_00335 [Methylobacterium terrae]|uniref:Metal-binding protein n=1 Tax=Methylobacterium terrae TaxID=2202827 RepID=A0A2U8WFF9_9HYPH|nr:DUF2182 domain-containing protein [Methylobacterium terrae]AWN44964.1 hypothetical protein DK419_00335 [Methylobacterium terrae]
MGTFLMSPAARERMGVRVPVLAAGAVAWLGLAAIPIGWTLPAACAGGIAWRLPSADEVILALAVTPPAALAATWILMVAAMMGPTLVAPLCHLRARSLASGRGRAVALFLAGYAAAWSIAGIGLAALALVLLPAGPAAALAPVLLAALLWQASPAKQRCLNRCHARPPLAAFGAAARRDAWWFGLAHGAWCAGSCWALMLVMLVLPAGHLAAMAVLAAWILAERLAPATAPGWRWRPWRAGPALRVAAALAARHRPGSWAMPQPAVRAEAGTP